MIDSNNTKRKFSLKSLQGKIVITFVLCGIAIFFVAYTAMSIGYDKLTNALVRDQLETSLRIIDTTFDDGQWEIIDGTLYCGDVALGDGTLDKANNGPFENLAKKMGDNFFGFVGIKNEDGTFTRVAGNTKDQSGDSIVGTKLDDGVGKWLTSSDSYLGNIDIDGIRYISYYETLHNSKGEQIGYVVAAKDVTQVDRQLRIFKHLILLSLILVLIVAELTLIYRTRRWVHAIGDIKDYLKEMGTGEFPEESLNIKTHDEIEEVAESINEMKESLMKNKRIAGELAIAQAIQKSMLPRVFPPYPERNEFNVFAGMEAAREVGGDLYDVFMPDEKHLTIVIADVSGKGIPAALIMAISKIIIKNYASDVQNPAKVLSYVNDKLAADNEQGFFLTAWIGVLDLETGVLSYSNAGHNPPAVRLNGGQYKLLNVDHGFVIGGFEGIDYKLGQIQMNPGDSILLYTDGVTEAQTTRGEFYGEERLLEYLNSSYDKDEFEVVNGLRDDLKKFAEEQEQFDDITMLYMKYNGDIPESLDERIFDAKVENLIQVQEFVDEKMEKAGLSIKTTMDVSLAIEELFTNVASYAYEGYYGSEDERPDNFGKVAVAIKCEDNNITLRMSDWGVQFDPLAKNPPDTTLDADEREFGGLGIHLVRKLMDHVEYRYEDNKNILEMRKEY